MPSELHALDTELENLLSAVSGSAYRQTLKHLAKGLRKRNQQRQGRQQNPDGSAWEPRKAQRETIAQKKMMLGLRKPAHFKIRQQADAIRLGYTGRSVHIARIHHYGMRDKPAPHVKAVNYPVRGLLGVTAADQAWMRDELLKRLANR